MNLLKECKTSLIISATILIGPLLLIISSVTHGMIYHNFYIMAYIPVFVITFLLSLIRKIPNAVRIAIVSVITVAAYICLIYLGIIIGDAQFKAYYGEKAITGYEESWEYLGIDADECEDVASYVYKENTIFASEAYTHILRFSGTDFEKAKSKIEAEVKFYKEPVLKEDPIPECSVDGFDFRLMVRETEYPKEMSFIGINNTTKEIAFVDFFMKDLDGVWDFADLMIHDCGWRYISEKRAG